MLIRFICADDSLVKGPTQLEVGKTYQIGRSSKCCYVLGHRSVSRVHAEMEVHEKSLHLKDLKSRNGTFVNGDKVQEVELTPGQKVYFGSVPFQLINGELPSDGDDEALSHASTFIVRGQKLPIAKLLAQLSEAQIRVLEQLKKGLAEKEVAANLDLSTHTVHNHTKAIYRKLNVNSRPELLALFMMGDDES